MKKSLILSMVIGCMGMGSMMTASAVASNPSVPYKYRLPQRPTKNRPNAPSRVFIECEYSAGVLYFVLPADVEYADIYVESAGAVVFSGDITADECALLVPGLTGEYTITCITDDGREFVGDITLN